MQKANKKELTDRQSLCVAVCVLWLSLACMAEALAGLVILWGFFGGFLGLSLMYFMAYVAGRMGL